MIKVDKLSYSFPQKNLYNEILFTLEDNQHCAFIGMSGTGKSTLMNMIMDPEKYNFSGKLEITPGYKIGYVSQFAKSDEVLGMTVFEYIGYECLKLQEEIALICAEMETSNDIESLLEKYQEKLDEFESLGGNDFESNINKKLNLADLLKYKDLKISEISGGEFKLVQVIKEMLNKPDLLIMDEPDVFLDFENLNSLRNLINTHNGTLLVITHNRYLLDHCFNKILHLENTELQEFDGSYTEYNFALLERKIELQELATKDTEEIERNEKLIEQFRDIASNVAEATRGNTVRARIKIQERLEARRIKTPFVYINQPNINLTTNNELEETIALKVDNYNVLFDDSLLENVSFEIKSNEKVAIIGPNGTGKTTLLRDIFKNTNNTIEINENIKMAYLSQHQSEMLNYSNTIMDEFLDSGFNTYAEVTEYLAGYGFEGKILNHKIDALSGGEKNILQLAKISASNANMLLLDEPTSHLDTYSQLALEKAINNYNGAIIMISHDIYSIINCMDYVLIIEDKSIRKMNMKKFKRMVYNVHFDRDYLKLEQKKKQLEARISIALVNNDFVSAKIVLEDLRKIIELI